MSFLDGLLRAPAAPATLDASHVLTSSTETLEAGANYIFGPAQPSQATLPDAVAAAGRRLSVTFPSDDNSVTAIAGNQFVLDRGWTTPGPLEHLPAGIYEFRAVYDPSVYAFGFWLVRSPEQVGLSIYPSTGALDGTEDTSSDLRIGCLNLLNTSASSDPWTLALVVPTGAARPGERFAIKVSDSVVGRSITITVPGGQQIESPATNYGASTVSFEAQLGTYAEWIMGIADQWLLVAWIPGFAGG